MLIHLYGPLRKPPRLEIQSSQVLYVGANHHVNLVDRFYTSRPELIADNKQVLAGRLPKEIICTGQHTLRNELILRYIGAEYRFIDMYSYFEDFIPTTGLLAAVDLTVNDNAKLVVVGMDHYGDAPKIKCHNMIKERAVWKKLIEEGKCTYWGQY